MTTPSTWADFVPHGFCLAWDPGLIWLQAGSDLVIALAYYSIPAALLVFLRRRRDLAFRPVFILFAAFILACGTTHLFGLLTLWRPYYWLDGAVKAVTAALSIVTAIMLWPLLPKALALPSPAALRAVNAALAQQIAERDEAMTLLRAREQQLLQLYARSPAVLHAVDAQGMVLEVSDEWLNLFGYRRQDVIGRNIHEFYTPDSQHELAARTVAMHPGQSVVKTHRRVICADLSTRATEATLKLEVDSAGALQRVLVALTDVTARQEAEEALRASEERLRHAQKMEAVGQLTGGIAHDFNNLLTTIMGSLELLERRESLDARGQRLTANALEGARRAARLTSQLLSFSRRQRLAPESLEPAHVVAGIRDLLERTLGESILLETTQPPDGLWPVMADRNQLEVSLLNLIINARDAIQARATEPDGRHAGEGVVAISFANHTLAQRDAEGLSSDPMAPGDYVAISVRDDGSGMKPEILAHAFEPFFTTKKTGAGTGLGLAQTYGFATQSGGTVYISSEVGTGTCVDILLPRAIASATGKGQAEQAEPAPLPMGRGETILLVEDDALLRHTVAGALEEQGFRVVTAAHGAAALAALEAGQKVDLMFTDVMMPGGMNGVEVAQAARRLRPALKVMFATGYSDRHVLAQWPEALDLLAKPYALREVTGRIARRLGATACSEVSA